MNTVQDINFTPKVRRALDVATQRCIENNCPEITDEFLLHAVLFSESMIVNLVFQSLSIDVKDVILTLSKSLPSNKKKLANSKIGFAKATTEIIDASYEISQSFKQNYTGVEHLFLSLLRKSDPVKKFFKKNGVDVAYLAEKVEKECKLLSNPVKKPIPSKQQNQQEWNYEMHLIFQTNILHHSLKYLLW